MRIIARLHNKGPDFPSEVGFLEGSIQAFCEVPRRTAA